MEAARWSRIEALFERALDLPEAERAGFLERECGDDAELLRELQKLVVSAADTHTQLGEVIAGEARHLVAGRIAKQIGRVIGPYRITELLGEGGMGAVYLAKRADFAQQVAIKIVSRAMGSPQAVARFRDERQILAALVHPNIVRLLDGGSTSDDLPYIVMEHVDGSPITKYADAQQLGIRDRIQLVLRMCRALQYAHANLVVHRDIKPSNVLVDREGVPKILDFGIAKLVAPTSAFEREAMTRTGSAPFTPEYASPEQARGEAVATTTDVYSTGAVLFELLTGRTPIQIPGASVIELVVAIVEVDPPRASTVAPADRRKQLVGDLDNIVAKALHKEVAHRYASMEALADDLERYLDGLPVGARTATLGYRLGKLVRRNKGTVVAATAIAAALITATVVSLRQAHRADEQATRADTAATDAAAKAKAADEAAATARTETARAQTAEAQVQQQLDALRTANTARTAAEADAKEKGTEAQLSRDELAAALVKAQDEKALAEAESKRAKEAEAHAEQAAAAEKAASEKLAAALEKEQAHTRELEAEKKKITSTLP